MMWHHKFLRLRTRRRALRPRRNLRRWAVERMEDRALLSTFWVTKTADNGGVNPAPGADTGTLRQAIIDTNNDTSNQGTDTIDFAIPGSGVQMIQPLSQLPIVTHLVIINGYSQPGSSENSLGVGDNAVLLIELEGSLAGNASTGTSSPRASPSRAWTSTISHSPQYGSMAQAATRSRAVSSALIPPARQLS